MGSKLTDKKDYFGRPMKEKFPYYPYGVIIPGCKTGPCSRHRPASSKSSKNPAQKTSCIPSGTSKQIQDKSKIVLQQSTTATTTKTNVEKDKAGPSSSSRTIKNPMDSAEACRKIAMLVAQQLPQCSSEEFLQEIEQKCRNYWDALGRHSIYLDENEVCKELTLKLQAWAQCNENCCDYHHDLRSPSSSYENVTPTMDHEEESRSRQIVNGDDEEEDDYYDELGEYEDQDDTEGSSSNYFNQQVRIQVRGLP